MVCVKVSRQMRVLQLTGVSPSHGWNSDAPPPHTHKDMPTFQTLEAATVTSLGKRAFADVMKVRVETRAPWTIWWAPNPMAGIFTKEKSHRDTCQE